MGGGEEPLAKRRPTKSTLYRPFYPQYCPRQGLAKKTKKKLTSVDLRTTHLLSSCNLETRFCAYIYSVELATLNLIPHHRFGK